MIWVQRQLVLPPHPRGFHLITSRVCGALNEIHSISAGLLHVFLQHTSASISLNENADPDVRVDLESAFNRMAPESAGYIHTCEGPDDMPAHVKSSVIGASLTIPITDGRPAMGTWQGIYLCEHRDHATSRRLMLTAMGVA